MQIRSLLLGLFLCCTVASTGQQPVQEVNLKAAFMYNFTRYITWEESTQSNYFIFGVLGTTPMTEALKKIAGQYDVGNKNILVRNFSSLAEMSYCNILFIPAKTGYRMADIAEKLPRGVLTITEEPGMAARGSGFNFVVINDKLKFEVNLKTLYLSGIRVSSQLLKLAVIVN
ncbi:MAG: YfiR family protein [Sphingobacteriales bacterium]|nr:MAG: YfiR family protein [Sphingobacteriales bacterium]